MHGTVASGLALKASRCRVLHRVSRRARRLRQHGGRGSRHRAGRRKPWPAPPGAPGSCAFAEQRSPASSRCDHGRLLADTRQDIKLTPQPGRGAGHHVDRHAFQRAGDEGRGGSTGHSTTRSNSPPAGPSLRCGDRRLQHAGGTADRCSAQSHAARKTAWSTAALLVELGSRRRCTNCSPVAYRRGASLAVNTRCRRSRPCRPSGACRNAARQHGASRGTSRCRRNVTVRGDPAWQHV